jgi:hypothetical protein
MKQLKDIYTVQQIGGFRKSPKNKDLGSGGRGRIRTDERRSGRIYSPHPLATWIPYQ